MSSPNWSTLFQGGSTAGIQAGTGNLRGAASGGLATAAAIDPEPISKTFLTIAATMSRLFGFGANPQQVPASQLEQSIEAAADNVHRMYIHGLITLQQKQQGITALLQLGTQQFQQYITRAQQTGDSNTYKAFTAGLQNMTKVVTDVARTNPTPTPSGETLSVQSASKYYVTTAEGKWYPGSVDRAAQLANSLIQDWQSSVTAQIGGIAGTIGDEVLSLFGAAGQPAAGQTSQQSTVKSNSKLVGWGVIGFIAAKLLHFI